MMCQKNWHSRWSD